MPIDPNTLNLAQLEQQHGLPSGLLQSVMGAESAGNPNAVSPKGAQGLFQFMPQTAKAYGINPLDPQQAAVGAARMYGDLSKQFGGDVPSMLAAYNWGSGNLTRKGMQNAPKETQDYIAKVQQGMSNRAPLNQYASNDTGTMNDAMDAKAGDTIDVELPDGTTIQGVPSNVTQAQLMAMLQKNGGQSMPTQQIGSVEDTAKSVGSNVVGGAIDTAMILPNLINTVVAGPQLLGRGIADTVSPMLGVTPQPRGELWQPLYGSGDVEKAIGTDYEPQTTAGKVAALPARITGGVLGVKGLQAASPKVGKLLSDTSSGAPAKTPKTTSDDIRSMANQAYAKADELGGVLKPSVTNKFLDDVDSLAPQTAEGRLLAGDSAFTKIVEVLKQLRDRPLTLKAAQEIDEILGDKVDDFVDRTTGALSKEGKKLLDVQTSFRKAMDEASPNDVAGKGFEAWKSGKKLWSQAAKLRDVEKIINRAEMTDNPASAIKTGFRNLYTNKARMRGFSKDEATLIKRAAETGIISDTLRIFGSRLIPIGASVAGGGLGGTAAAAAGSMASRSAATKLQVNRAGKVADTIAANATKQQPQTQQPTALTKFSSGYNPVMTPVAVSPLAAFGAKFDRKVTNKPMRITVRPEEDLPQIDLPTLGE